MPMPKPSRDDYDSHHDSAYLWEDYWADQERFKEAPTEKKSKHSDSEEMTGWKCQCWECTQKRK